MQPGSVVVEVEMLRESYVSDLKNVPAKHRVFVMRRRGHDALAPSDALFADFKAREAEWKKTLPPVEAHNRAWDDVRYEERFTREFWANPAAVAELRALKELARSADVWLICYEKPPKHCHRHLLIALAKQVEAGTGV